MYGLTKQDHGLSGLIHKEVHPLVFDLL